MQNLANYFNCDDCGCTISVLLTKQTTESSKTLIGSVVEWQEQGHYECPHCGFEYSAVCYMESNGQAQDAAFAAQYIKDVKILLDGLNAKGVQDLHIWRVLRLGPDKLNAWRRGEQCTAESVALLASIWLRPELIAEMDV